MTTQNSAPNPSQQALMQQHYEQEAQDYLRRSQGRAIIEHNKMNQLLIKKYPKMKFCRLLGVEQFPQQDFLRRLIAQSRYGNDAHAVYTKKLVVGLLRADRKLYADIVDHLRVMPDASYNYEGYDVWIDYKTPTNRGNLSTSCRKYNELHISTIRTTGILLFRT